MKELEQYRKALKKLPEGCTAAEAEAEKEERLLVEMSGTALGRMSCSEQAELFVRASGEKTGMVYTQKLDEDAEEVLKQALKNSEVSASKEPELMSSPVLWEGKTPSQTAQKLVSVKALKAAAAALANALHEEAEREQKQYGGEPEQIQLSVSQVIRTIGIVNSNGVDQTSSSCRFTAEAGTGSGYEEQISSLTLEGLTAEPLIRSMKQRQMIRQPQIPAEPGVYRAVLSSNTVNNILITAWQMFTARRAQNGSTPFAGKEGQQIFSPCVTIRDYCGGPDTKNSVPCGYSWGMDCEGVPAQDTVLVENGVLKTWMNNLATAKAGTMEPAGNAGRRTLLSGNIHTDMAIMPKNFTIESGNATLEELLAACGDGIYIFENYDQFHSLNVVSGDFAFPCKALRIKDGRPVGLMSGLTMNGNVRDLFAKVELLGCDRVIDPMAMYESYTVSGPAMLVSELKISG